VASCEKCWLDAHRDPYMDVVDEYHRLIEERTGDKRCTPEEQAGPEATECAACGARTVHQFAMVCMKCGKDHRDPHAGTPQGGDR
jgi:hypothetical protein